MILKDNIDNKKKKLVTDESACIKNLTDDWDQALLADEDFLNAIVTGLEEMEEDEDENCENSVTSDEDLLLKKYGF